MIRRSNDNMIFRRRAVSPGVYYADAHTFYQNLPLTFIVSIALTVTGNDQSIISLGTAGGRFIEFGISDTGRTYVWGSGAKVETGLALSDGDHYIGFTVTRAGGVTITVDGSHHGVIAVVPGTSVDRFGLGQSCLGGLVWSNTIKETFVYLGIYEDVNSLMGYPAASFDPSVLAKPGDQWIWIDLDADGARIFNPQPNLSNSEFLDGGLDWTGGPDWSFAVGSATHNVGNITSLEQDVLISGNRTVYEWDLIGGAGSCGNSSLGTPARSLSGTYNEEGTQLDTYFRCTPTIDFDGSVTAIRNLRNTSLTRIDCRGNLGNVVQATDLAMPWSSDANAPSSVLRNGKHVMYFAGNGDYIRRIFDVAVPQPWHIYCVSRIKVDTNNTSLIDGGAGNDARLLNNHAIEMGKLIMFAGATGPRLPFILNATEIYECSFNGASSFGTTNGGAKIFGDAGAANVAGVTLSAYGSLAGVGSMNCEQLFYFGINRVLTDTERLEMDAYLKCYYAI